MTGDVASRTEDAKPADAGPAGMAAPGSLLRHVLACHTAVLPGRRYPFHLGSAQVGWVLPDFALALVLCPGVSEAAGGIRLADPAALPRLAKALARAGWFRWRGEAFDVRAAPDGPVLAELDRGALPAFGVEATGVHVNGIVETPDGPCLWVARRAANKALDPGKLDHIVAGGVPAGLSPAETLVKEAAEEAAIPPDLARAARPVGVFTYAMERPEGLRRDRLHAYDLLLPADFVPRAADGEVESFDLWDLARVEAVLRAGDAFKFNVALVLVDLLLRRGRIPVAEAAALRAALSSRPAGR